MITDNPQITTTDYQGIFHYENEVLKFFATAEGYVNVLTKGNKTAYNYVYNYTDHLGNIRLSYTESPEGEVEVLEENHYYPFGLKHKKYGSVDKQLVSIVKGETYYVGIEAVSPGERLTYQYKYQNKEWQDELNLNFYDYHARNYDPAIVRTPTLDPHAENYFSLSPYSFLANSPLVFVDPDGKDIYRYDKKSGDLVLMQETEDKFDQIANYKYDKKTKEYTLQTDRKGNTKTSVDNIAKGILKDGINFKENNNIIEVNGAGQPTEQNVIDFLVAYSDNVAKVEVSGYGLNDGGSLSENISAILVWEHKGNKWNQASDVPYDKNTPIHSSHRGSYKGKSRFAKYHYHTHPKVGQYEGGNINEASKEDYFHKSKANLPHWIFNINGRYPY